MKEGKEEKKKRKEGRFFFLTFTKMVKVEIAAKCFKRNGIIRSNSALFLVKKEVSKRGGNADEIINEPHYS